VVASPPVALLVIQPWSCCTRTAAEPVAVRAILGGMKFKQQDAGVAPHPVDVKSDYSFIRCPPIFYLITTQRDAIKFQYGTLTHHSVRDTSITCSRLAVGVLPAFEHCFVSKEELNEKDHSCIRGGDADVGGRAGFPSRSDRTDRVRRGDRPQRRGDQGVVASWLASSPLLAWTVRSLALPLLVSPRL